MEHWSQALYQDELKQAQSAYRRHVGRHFKGLRVDRNGHVIKVLMTFEEWMNIWWESGHWYQRGNKKASDFVMSRINDLGDYCVGNVRIISHGENISEHLRTRVGPIHPLHGKPSPKRGVPISEDQRQTCIWNAARPCTNDGVRYFLSKKAMSLELGHGKSGARSPDFRYVTLEEYLRSGSRKSREHDLHRQLLHLQST